MKKNILIAILSLIFVNLFCFDWPQEEIIESDSFYSYFGQLRGTVISNSLVFADSSTIKASEDGFLTLYITDQNDESDFFPSTLGNAALISHDDNLMTIYANIDSESLTEENFKIEEAKTGTILGQSGNSSWQEGKSSLEFQVIDLEKNISINPRLLMPRFGNELPLSITDVKLQNVKNTRIYSLPETTSIPAGTYRVYKKRQNIACPFRTSISLNGTIVDTISFDLLKNSDGLNCAVGKKNYIKNQIYPNNSQMLMGELTIPPGKNTLRITVTNLLEKSNSLNYTISAW